MKRTYIVFACVITIALSGCNTTGETKNASLIEGHLKNDELRALFSGKTADWEKPKASFTTYAGPDGEMVTHFTRGSRAGKTIKLRWSIENDQQCGHSNGESRCGYIIPKGNGVYHKIRDGEYKATIRNFVAGKTF